ncbi:uncharacterized protein LOC131856504 [Cryptomeria japonica]|uniref:uncharacterized protein LOC131856504 n=1 Tax=Cryptomeria japonica TaxID=3369 RepID=UPI0027D9F47C|nr:uncharacterized protein LOC131856504 [Cryptomeria japonica]
MSFELNSVFVTSLCTSKDGTIGTAGATDTSDVFISCVDVVGDVDTIDGVINAAGKIIGVVGGIVGTTDGIGGVVGGIISVVGVVIGFVGDVVVVGNFDGIWGVVGGIIGVVGAAGTADGIGGDADVMDQRKMMDKI